MLLKTLQGAASEDMFAKTLKELLTEELCMWPLLIVSPHYIFSAERFKLAVEALPLAERTKAYGVTGISVSCRHDFLASDCNTAWLLVGRNTIMRVLK